MTRKRANADIWPEAVQADQSQIANPWPEAVQSGGGEPGCAAEMLAVKMYTTTTFVIKTESRKYRPILFHDKTKNNPLRPVIIQFA